MNTNIKFTNLIELHTYFNDKQRCIEHLENLRWAGKITCPHCEAEKIYRCKGIGKYKCGKCKKRFSVTTGTFFENTKIPLSKWFIAMYLCLSHKKGVSSCQLARDISVSQKTAWFILQRVRALVIEQAPTMLENIIEADEAYLGGKISNKHKKVRYAIQETKNTGRNTLNKTMVAGALQRDGKVINEVVKDVKAGTLLKFLSKNVKPGSIMVTDAWKAYKGLTKLEYIHEVVDHSKDEYVRGKFHTNSIEGYWSQLKRGIYGVYHQCSSKHLHRYCNEFAFKWNTRKFKEGERFNLALSNAKGRLTYNALTEKPVEKNVQTKGDIGWM